MGLFLSIHNFFEDIFKRGTRKSFDPEANLEKNTNERNTKVSGRNEIVIAVELGMANAGFAFWRRGCKHEIFADKLNINRVPAAVLFNRDKTLHSFGYQAVRSHYRQALNKKHSQYLYFKYFALSLYEMSRCNTLCSTDCEDIPCGVHLLSQVLDSLRDNAIKSMMDILPNTNDNIVDQIELILTTPVSVTDNGKTLIMQAVKNSKFDEKRFCWVSESAATAWLCKCQQLQITKSNELDHMPMSSKYIVGDLGAGKSVISVYEIKSETMLKQLDFYVKNIGGHSVNDKFECFMKKICKSGEWENFKANKHGEYEQLLKQFEEEKIRFDNETECVILSLTNSLFGIIKESKSKTSGEEETGVVDDKLVIQKKQMEIFFKRSIKEIVKVFKTIRSNYKRKELNKILLVGGYSESEYLRAVLKAKLSSFDISLVQNPQMAALNGALMLGLKYGPVREGAQSEVFDKLFNKSK